MMSSEEKRFDQTERRTDKNLFQELCEKFEQHVERFEKHELEEAARSKQLFEAQQANAEAIAQLTHSVSEVVKGTESIVQLHKDFQGAARVGRGLQGFMFWILKWGAIGTGIVAIINWLIGFFNHAN